MKLGETDLQAVLGRVAELARQTLHGVIGASVTLVESDRAFTRPAFAGQLALDLDARPAVPGGLRPLPRGRPVGGNRHRPRHGGRDPLASIRPPSPGRRSALLPVGGTASPGSRPRRTQHLRRPARHLRPGRHRAAARTFAHGYAAVAIANARLYQATATLAEDMSAGDGNPRRHRAGQRASSSRQRHCTPEQAFEMLTRLSQATHPQAPRLCRRPSSPAPPKTACAADPLSPGAAPQDRVRGSVRTAAGGYSGVAQVTDDLAE